MKVDSRKTNSVWCTSGGEWCTLSFRGSLTAWRCPHCVCLFQVAHFKEFIPQAFPGGHSMILDAEVLLIDTNTSKPLPFGTLGVHKVRTAPNGLKLCSHEVWSVSLLTRLSSHCLLRKPPSRMPKCVSLSSTVSTSTVWASWRGDVFHYFSKTFLVACFCGTTKIVSCCSGLHVELCHVQTFWASGLVSINNSRH